MLKRDPGRLARSLRGPAWEHTEVAWKRECAQRVGGGMGFGEQRPWKAVKIKVWKGTGEEHQASHRTE